MLRFTIRDLLLLMVAVSLVLALLIERTELLNIRSHAWLLRDSLEHARIHFMPVETRNQHNDEINWALADAPIP
jgi:hypothetical protein